jgi:hypothetical protein
MHYLSDKCKKVIVYIICNEFIYEYNYHIKINKLPSSQINIPVIYKIINENDLLIEKL